MSLPIATNIKNEVESVFGRRILTSRDCVQLSEAIFQKTAHQLNSNTLRRFFGLVKTSYSPSQTTLTILSKYCGYHCLTDANSPRYDDTTIHEDYYDLLSFMLSLFRDVPVDNGEDKTFINMVYNTVGFLNRNPAFATKFQIEVAKTKNGQEFYFEKFVNIDKLNGYYGNGLRYYSNEKSIAAAKIFAHSLLVYRYWLTGNLELLNKHYSILQTIEQDENIPHFINGRLWAAYIYYAEANGLPVEPIIQKAFNNYITITREKRGGSFPRFELYLAEATLLTGHANESLLFINPVKQYQGEENEYVHWKFSQNFLLLEALAACKMEDFVYAEKIFQTIDPSQFYFLRKSFSNLLYLHLIAQLKRQNVKHLEQSEALIRETGFTRLRQLFSSSLLFFKQSA